MTFVPRRPSFVTPALALLTALAACRGDAARPHSAARVDTVGGIEQVSYAARRGWTTGAPWRLDSTQAVQIGKMDGDDAYVFGHVVGAMVAADGRVYVADQQTLQVRIFSAAGEFLGSFGRAGEGPGEFRNLGGLGRAPEGGVAVVDEVLARVSLFGPEGQFQRSFRLDRPFRVIGAGAPVRFDAQGRYHDLAPLSRRAGAVDSTGVMRYTPEGTVEETRLLWAHEPQRLAIMEDGRLQASLQIPFTSRPSAAIDSRGRAYIASGDGYRIALVDAAGDTVRVLVRDVQPVPVDAARRDSALVALADRYRQTAGVEPRALPAIAGEMPAILSLQVDESDHLWVQRPSRDAALQQWDVFDPEGAFWGELETPAMQVTHIGERTITGISADGLVPTVRILTLVR